MVSFSRLPSWEDVSLRFWVAILAESVPENQSNTEESPAKILTDSE